MRLIKFRAWDYGSDPAKKRGMKGQMVLVDYLTWEKNGTLSEVNHEMPKWFSPPMQFTGLHDKNGREIYEGDFVRMKQSAWGYVEHLLVIEYDQDYFSLKARCVAVNSDHKTGVDVGDAYSFSVLDRHKDTVEIVGNIFENPELLSIAAKKVDAKVG